MIPKVLIPTGYGLNCEEETANLFQMSGAKTKKVHINDLRDNPQIIADYHIIALIGGFSDGDHIAGGKIHANRLKYGLKDELTDFIQEGKLIIGICNGFQALVKSGFLPGYEDDHYTQKLTLTYNDSGKFEDRWVNLGVNHDSHCVWTKNIDELYFPVRHGEGKVRVPDSVQMRLETTQQITLYYVKPGGKTPTMQYPYNPNGSDGAIAGICDTSGRVFALMPHPEAYWSPYNHPNWSRLKLNSKLPNEGMGLLISRNGVEYAREHLI